jgi:hypothetical protein
MSHHSSRSCLCLLGGKCSAYPNGRESRCYGTFSTTTSPTFAEIQNFRIKINSDLEVVSQQLNAHENTINHTQEGIKKCFDRIEKTEKLITNIVIENDLWIKPKTEKIENPFEFIAVDAKRRDDIRHIKDALYELYKWLLDNIQENKERSKGIERLEEAAMWLNKSISRRIDNGTQNEK